MFVQIRVTSDTFTMRNYLKYLTLQMEDEVYIKDSLLFKTLFSLKKEDTIFKIIKGSIWWKDTIMNVKHLLTRPSKYMKKKNDKIER